MMTLRDLKKLDRDDLLKLIGLQERADAADWLLPALGFFGAGLVVGAGLGLLLAPKSGRELRQGWKRLPSRAGDGVAPIRPEPASVRPA